MPASKGYNPKLINPPPEPVPTVTYANAESATPVPVGGAGHRGYAAQQAQAASADTSGLAPTDQVRPLNKGSEIVTPGGGWQVAPGEAPAAPAQAGAAAPAGRAMSPEEASYYKSLTDEAAHPTPGRVVQAHDERVGRQYNYQRGPDPELTDAYMGSMQRRDDAKLRQAQAYEPSMAKAETEAAVEQAQGAARDATRMDQFETSRRRMDDKVRVDLEAKLDQLVARKAPPQENQVSKFLGLLGAAGVGAGGSTHEDGFAIYQRARNAQAEALMGSNSKLRDDVVGLLGIQKGLQSSTVGEKLAIDAARSVLDRRVLADLKVHEKGLKEAGKGAELKQFEEQLKMDQVGFLMKLSEQQRGTVSETEKHVPTQVVGGHRLSPAAYRAAMLAGHKEFAVSPDKQAEIEAKGQQGAGTVIVPGVVSPNGLPVEARMKGEAGPEEMRKGKDAFQALENKQGYIQNLHNLLFDPKTGKERSWVEIRQQGAAIENMVRGVIAINSQLNLAGVPNAPDEKPFLSLGAEADPERVAQKFFDNRKYLMNSLKEGHEIQLKSSANRFLVGGARSLGLQ